MDRGEMPRKISFGPEIDMQQQEFYRKKKTHNITFLIGRKNSGEDFILQCIHTACMTDVMYDFGDCKFYDGIVHLWNIISSNKECAGHLKQPPGAYRKPMDADGFERSMLFNLFSMMTKKVTSITCMFGNEFMYEFLECIRDMGDKHELWKVNIIFLANNEEDKRRCNRYRELGEKVISYNDFLQDPIGILCMMNPSYFPNRKLLEELINEAPTI